MSPKAQRIAIAEARGWNNLQDSDYKPFKKAQLVGKHPGGSAQNLLLIPDYPKDLNAMHEEENMLTHEQRTEYLEWLGMCSGDDANKVWAYVHATAAQRAEAFLRTIGKWEASK
jgi:hypothetical protein